MVLVVHKLEARNPWRLTRLASKVKERKERTKARAEAHHGSLGVMEVDEEAKLKASPSRRARTKEKTKANRKAKTRAKAKRNVEFAKNMVIGVMNALTLAMVKRLCR